MKKIIYISAFILTVGTGFLFSAREVSSPLATAPPTIQVANVITEPVVEPVVSVQEVAIAPVVTVVNEVAPVFTDQTVMFYLTEICSNTQIAICYEKMSIAYYSRAFLYTEANYIIVSDRVLTFLLANQNTTLFKLMDETSRVIATL